MSLLLYICLLLCSKASSVKFDQSADGLKNSPNVLFVVVDDLRTALGCYGDRVVTPNIDQFATRSAKFENAYAQQGVCAPSRNSFLTSRRPDTTRLYDFNSYWRKVAGNFTTLPQYFKQNGYFTASVGKIFHPGRSSGHDDDYPYSWSTPAYHPPTLDYARAKVCKGSWDQDLHNNIVCPVNVSEQPGKSLPDIQSTQHAIAILKNISSREIRQPFFLAVGYHKPHINLKYPKDFLQLYPLSNMTLAPDHTLPPGMPKVAWNVFLDVTSRDDVSRLNVTFPYGPIPIKYQYHIRQSYYAATSYMDSLVGHLLSALDQLDLAKDTIVSLHADHGWSLGEHQEWAKYSNFEVVTKVPMIVYVPGVTHQATPGTSIFPYQSSVKHDVTSYNESALFPTLCDKEKIPNKLNISKTCGYSSDALVELVDLFPTLVDLSGLKPLPTCPVPSNKVDLCTEGASFAPVIYNISGKDKKLVSRIRKWKAAAFSQYPRPSYYPQNNSYYTLLKDIKIMGYSMRTPEYRYTEWVHFNHSCFCADWNHIYARELYTHNTDPMENINRAYEHGFRSLVKEASALLHKGWTHALPHI